MNFARTFGLSTLLAIAFSGTVWAAETFGRFQDSKTPALPLASVLERASNGEEFPAPLRIEGRVEKVCEKEGCWVTLDDGGKSVRVSFKGHSFVVPAKLKGQKVMAEGRLTRSEVSVAKQKHLLEDEGAPASQIAAIKAPKVEFEFVADGIRTF